MKGKLALLTFLATTVTIGGVYATWTFAEKSSTAANTTVNVAMTGVNSETEKGTLSVMVMASNGFTLSVDDANGDHYAEVKKEGVVTVTFKPSANASADVKQYGVDVQCVVSYAPYTGGPQSLEEWTYNESQIFSIGNNESDPILLNSNAAVYSEETGLFTWTIPASDIDITLANEFFIDSLEKYNAMNAELAKGHFVLTVSEYTAS